MSLPDTLEIAPGAEEDENYHESSDDDFSPTAVPAEDTSESEDDDEATTPSGAHLPTKNKRKRKDVVAEFDSGDEKMVEEARRRKKAKAGKGSRKGKGAEDDEGVFWDDDDEGGEGGLVKTRAQRRAEREVSRGLQGVEGATVDVEGLWREMMEVPVVPVGVERIQEVREEVGDISMAGADGHATTDTEGEELTVLRVYTFAGQKTAEEKRIPRSSLGQYLRDGWKQPTSDVADKTKDVDIKTSKSDTVDADDDKQPKLHRPLRRPLRRPSRFDPNPSAFVRGLAPEFQLTYPRKPTSSSSSVPAIHVIDNTQENTPGVTQHINGLRPYKAQKLNVVDKSRLDWTGYVDQEGIAEELDVHGKGREAYLGRMEFLRGVEARREEERRRVKEKVGNKAGAV